MEIDRLIERVSNEVNARIKMQDSPAASFGYAKEDISKTLELSLLEPDIALDKILDGAKRAKQLRLANICVSPYYVSAAADFLRDTEVAVCAAVGFPHGAASARAKETEIREAMKNGATELDVEMNILAIKSGDFDGAKKELEELCSLARGKAKFKAIYEQAMYTDEEKTKVLRIADSCYVDFIKISNALTGKKACVEDVRFVRSIVDAKVGIKIDGGIRTYEFASELLRAGANRFGVSRPEKVLERII